MKSIDACPRGPMNRTARWLTRCVLLLAAWAWGTAVWAQAVVTAGPSNNSQSVLMFDVQAITPVTVTGFSTVLASATPSVEIWGRSGSHVGFTNNFAGWTLLGTTPTMAVTPGAVTALPLTLDGASGAEKTATGWLTRVGLADRLLHPEVRGKRASWDAALDAVAEGFTRALDRLGPEGVALYVSGQIGRDAQMRLVEDHEATLKRFRRRGNMIALEAANPAYETRVFPDHMVKVQGRLVGLIRNY